MVGRSESKPAGHDPALERLEREKSNDGSEVHEDGEATRPYEDRSYPSRGMPEKAAEITLSTAQKALQSVIAPDTNEIEDSTRVLDPKIDGVSTKIDEVDRRLSTEIGAISEKVDTVRDVERLKIEVAELKKQN